MMISVARWLAFSAMIAVSVIPAGGAAAAVPVQITDSCGTVRATTDNSQGLRGGTVQATVCRRADGSAYFHIAYNNYVEDHQADGVAARAWVNTPGGIYGPIGVDSTSTPGGTSISWNSSNNFNSYVNVWVCLGTQSPTNASPTCAYGTF
ncbi:hypothetical protein GCM10010232_68170 [Streptomyces amakusaensis]|uniref:Secreted protein n=1 Tax=Streptomyces amakusaensis TaxID=67271 RepID=A0ABW0ASF3_9ACTN